MRKTLVALALGCCLTGASACGAKPAETTPTWPDDLVGALPSPPANGEPIAAPDTRVRRVSATIDRSGMFGDAQAWTISPETGRATHTTAAGTIQYAWSVPPSEFKDPIALTYGATATGSGAAPLRFEILVSETSLRSNPNQPRLAEGTAEGGQAAQQAQRIVLAPNDERLPGELATVIVHLRFGPRVIYTYEYDHEPAPSPSPSSSP